VKVTERTLEVTIAGEPSAYVLSVQLFQPVDPALSKHATLTSKVEVVLKKATAVQWTALEARPRSLLDVSGHAQHARCGGARGMPHPASARVAHHPTPVGGSGVVFG
jgi:hypothetical protein